MANRNLVRRIIELGYGAPEYRGGVMFFRVGALASNTTDWDAMLHAMSKIYYGRFDGQKLAEMLVMHRNMMSLVEFGREYSPVVYLHFDTISEPDLVSGNKTAVKNFIEMLDEMHDIEPDEADWQPARRCLRLWWD